MITVMNWGGLQLPFEPAVCSCGCTCSCSCNPASQRAGVANGTGGGMAGAISSSSGTVLPQPD